MSAIAERIDRRLSQLPPPRAARLEHLLTGLLDLVESENTNTVADEQNVLLRQNALAALNRIAARGGIAGIEDPAIWQQEQRADRPLPGREP
ncbi:MAG: hypothetical protein JWO94_1049 [Verrucomicrobiaceae bacterium]|nr:hypothetical protein [Verrucomicrobiaceae bacterium]